MLLYGCYLYTTDRKFNRQSRAFHKHYQTPIVLQAYSNDSYSFFLLPEGIYEVKGTNGKDCRYDKAVGSVPSIYVYKCVLFEPCAPNKRKIFDNQHVCIDIYINSYNITLILCQKSLRYHLFSVLDQH